MSEMLCVQYQCKCNQLIYNQPLELLAKHWNHQRLDNTKVRKYSILTQVWHGIAWYDIVRYDELWYGAVG